MTLTPGVAAAHQAILGDRLRLALDAELAHAVTGVPGVLAHPPWSAMLRSASPRW